MMQLIYIAGALTALLVLILLVVPYMLPVKKAQATYMQLPFGNSRFTVINGISIHYRVFEPADNNVRGNVLMIHGFCGSTFTWRKNAGILASQGYRVVCADLPGFGFSSRQQGLNHAPLQNARLLWLFVRQISAEKWHIFGHSMGASVAANMARLHAEGTAGLWFVDGFSFNQIQKKYVKVIGAVLTTAPAKRWAEAIGYLYFFRYNRIEMLLQSAYGQLPDREAIEGYLNPLLLPGTASCIMDIAKSIGTEKPVGVDQLKVPTCFIWGTKDTWRPINKFKSAIDDLPGVKLFLIEGAGHCPMETHSGAVNEFIIHHLNNMP